MPKFCFYPATITFAAAFTFFLHSHSCDLKVTAEGTMVSSLDLAHHKPYECLLLGYLPSKGAPTSKEEVWSFDCFDDGMLWIV